jgi:hypothetical protein
LSSMAASSSSIACTAPPSKRSLSGGISGMIICPKLSLVIDRTEPPEPSSNTAFGVKKHRYEFWADGVIFWC